MATLLMGFENSNGTMTDKRTGEVIQWDNMIIHVMSNDRAETNGWFCDHIKCKSKNAVVLGAESLEALLYVDPAAENPVFSPMVLFIFTLAGLGLATGILYKMFGLIKSHRRG